MCKCIVCVCMCVEETHACAHFFRRRLQKTITIGAHSSSPNPNTRDWPCVSECTTLSYIILLLYVYIIIIILLLLSYIRLCCYKRGSKDGKQVKQKPHRRWMIRRCETYIYIYIVITYNNNNIQWR